MVKKIRLIYFRFLIIAIAFVGIYTYFNWLLFIKYSIADIDEDVIQFWLPFCLPWIPILIWLWPRIKLLNLTTTNKKDNLPFLYMFVAALTIAAVTVFAQEYLETATGKLTILNTIDEIDKQAVTKYYKIESFYIDKENAGIKYFLIVTGKGNYLNLDIYIACPIYEIIAPPTPSKQTDSNYKQNPATIERSTIFVLNGKVIDSFEFHGIPKESIISIDTLNAADAINKYGSDGKNGAIEVKSKPFDNYIGQPPPAETISLVKACLCIEYHNQISNNLDTATEMRLRRQFYRESIKDFKNKDLNSFKYLDRIGNNNKRNRYKKAIERISHSNIISTVAILEPKYELFSERNGNKFIWIFGAFAIGAIIWLIMILIPSFDNDKLKEFELKNSY